MATVVYRTSVCVPKQQRAKRTPLFVISEHRPVHFEKQPLNEVFRFRWVPKHRISQAIYIRPIPVEEHKKGVVIFPWLPRDTTIHRGESGVAPAREGVPRKSSLPLTDV